MLSIGDFARHARVSVRMLRHYDGLGLLVPAYVDPVTGYRSYTAAQLPRANRLVALKDLGFTLEQVGPVLDAAVGVDELRGMLRLRRSELAERIDADRERLAAVERRLRTIESEGVMSDLEFTEKPLPAVRLAARSATAPDLDGIGAVVGPLFGRLAADLARSGVSPAGAAVATYDVGPDAVEIMAGLPVTAGAVLPDGVSAVDLASSDRAVCVLHHGPMETIGDTWQALAREVEARGGRPAGTSREVYLATPMDEPEAWVTELQQPVS